MIPNRVALVCGPTCTLHLRDATTYPWVLDSHICKAVAPTNVIRLLIPYLDLISRNLHKKSALDLYSSAWDFLTHVAMQFDWIALASRVDGLLKFLLGPIQRCR